MDIHHTSEKEREIFKISQPPSILAVAFTVLPLLVVTGVAWVMLASNVSLILLALLGAVLASSIALAMISMRLIGPVTLTLDRNGLEMERLLERKRFDWRDIAELRLVAAGGSFADDPAADGMKRVGIGVYLLASQVPGEAEIEADAIIVTTSSSQVISLQSLLTTILQYKMRAMSGGAAPTQRRMGPVQKPVAEFRRRPRVSNPAA